MGQTLVRYCPRCGTPIQEKAHLCPTCGLAKAAMLRRAPHQEADQHNEESATQACMPESAQMLPPSQLISQEHLAQCSPLPHVASSCPILEEPISPTSEHISGQAEPAITHVTAMQLPASPTVPSEPRDQPTLQESSQSEPELFVVRKPAQHIPSKRRVVLPLVLLVVLLILGTGGYLTFTGHLIQSPIKSVNLHIPLTYTGLSVTLLSVQQAQNFVDDPNTVNNGMVRLHLQEQNTTTTLITWNYARSTHLLVQGLPALAPVHVQSKGQIAPGATQTSMLDFAVPNGTNLSKVSLQLGSSDEAQIRVPLIDQTDFSQYQPQTLPQHGNMDYFGLNWTLTSSTTSLSIPGQQAANGMEYLTFTMIINNTLSQQAITGSPFDYVRVKTGGKIFNPISTTLPVSFARNQMGNASTITFLIPQNSVSGTFLLLSQDPGKSGQASTNFSLAHTSKF